jgi:hypothetical protein
VVEGGEEGQGSGRGRGVVEGGEEGQGSGRGRGGGRGEEGRDLEGVVEEREW